MAEASLAVLHRAAAAVPVADREAVPAVDREAVPVVVREAVPVVVREADHVVVREDTTKQRHGRKWNGTRRLFGGDAFLELDT